MANLNTLDDASAATQELFAAQPMTLEDAIARQEDAQQAQETQEQVEQPAPAESAPEQAQPASPAEQAAQVAEIAAQTAAEKNERLEQVEQQLAALEEQNKQLQGTIEELSKNREQNIVDEVLTPPQLDINSLAFADEETQQAEMAKFTEDLSAYNRQQIMKDLAPMLDFAKKGMHDAEKAETVEALSQIPELSGIKEMLPQLDRIIANNKWLSADDMPMDEKYINAYAMAKGINSINTPPAPEKKLTDEDLMQLYNSNPSFRDLVEKQRLEELNKSQQVPAFSASSGAVNAALNIKDKPQTLEEASRRTREMFGDV